MLYNHDVQWYSMILETKNILTSQTFNEDEVWSILDWFIDCFSRHSVDKVTLIYGFAWGNEIYNWEDQIVKVSEVREHIKNVESKDFGYLGCDDLYIKIGEDVQIQFCHHQDIHLNYNHDNNPLIHELVRYFTETLGLKK